MGRRLLLFVLILLISLEGFSQYLAKGKVLSLPGRQPISFVNIGIVNTPIGTISDEDGTFELRIPDGYTRDTVIISAVGYGSVRIPVKILMESVWFTVYLKESAKILEAVTITDEAWKRKLYKLGNRRMEGSIMVADTGTAGSAIALLIKNPPPGNKSHFEYPIYIERADLIIYDNTFPEFKVRTRLCEIDRKTGLPGDDLLNESVVIRSEIDSGNLRIDLSKYKLEINGDFFLVFEWILDKNDRKNLVRQFEEFRDEHPDKVSVDYSFIDGKKVHYLNYLGNFSAGPSFGISVSRKSVQNHVCYYRLNSFGEWKRSASILAANITLSDQPSWVKKGEPAPDSVFDGTMEELLSYYTMEPLGPRISSAQSVLKMEDSSNIYFMQRTKDPITIEVNRIWNKFIFNARSPSCFPYRLEMNFSGIFNMIPIISKKSITISKGLNQLLTLNVVDPSIPKFHYDLSVREIPGDTALTPDWMYPYFLPVKDFKKGIRVSSVPVSDYFGDVFEMIGNDTVFTMRKGLVTAFPGQKNMVDRVFADGTLEVYHSDGTIMVYKNLDPSKIFIKQEDYVYPGQPLGVILAGENLEAELYYFASNGSLNRMEIHYYSGESVNYQVSGIRNDYIVDYPDSIVMKEMTEKEMEKFNKNLLYP